MEQLQEVLPWLFGFFVFLKMQFTDVTNLIRINPVPKAVVALTMLNVVY